MRIQSFILASFLLASCSGYFGNTNQTAIVSTASPTHVRGTANGSATSTTQASPTYDKGIRTFTETGHTLRNEFRHFWEQQGGLAVFGYPLTEALLIDNTTVQYFERARFERQSDGTITLGRLGAEALQAQSRPIKHAVAQAGCEFFPETHHNICAPLLAAWQQAGGVAILGYPLTDVQQVAQMKVQYFERARFEVPDGGVPKLAPIGVEALDHLVGGGILQAASSVPAPQHAIIIGQTSSVQPLEQATVHVRIDNYSGPAEVLIADRHGATGRYPVQIADGTADVTVDALGTLGTQAAIVLIDGQIAGIGSNALLLHTETAIHTGQPRFDSFTPTVKGFMAHDTSDYQIDGTWVHGYRSPDSDLLWLRDHVHQSEGFTYWEPDMTSLLDQFRRFQRSDGSFDDYLALKPWGVVRGRIDVEADLEYLFVQGVYRAWQATGDDAWLKQQLDAMERGLTYIQTSPLRWDSHYQLVKRPFTIDTWDFEYGAPTTSPEGKTAPRHWIDADTKWCIFHGDNTGYADAMALMAKIYTYLGNTERADHWRHESSALMARLNAIAWNGTFFQHMVHLTPVVVPGVDEAQQLSLSNAYALNRAGITNNQAQSIIAEYHRRYENRGTTFSEWYSIDPPFPAGSLSTGPNWGQNPGEYVNGGLMPLVGGELARGAFRYYQEAYGFDILQRYYSLIAGTGGSYLWYYPTGAPGVSGSDTLATDGWGSSAMLAALIEGAAGVVDDFKQFKQVTLTPRWTATSDVNQAFVSVRYGASDGYIAYQWNRRSNGLDLHWTGSGDTIRLRLLLPQDAPSAVQATLNGQPVEGTIIKRANSHYFEVNVASSGKIAVTW